MTVQIDIDVDWNTQDDTGMPWSLLDEAADRSRIVAGAYVVAGRGTAVAVAEVIDVGEDAVVHLRPLPGSVSANAHLLGSRSIRTAAALDDGDRPLLTHLAEEFGEHGARAVEFLLTAAALLSGDSAAPRISEAACYCMREALKEIPQAAETLPRRDWRGASKSVSDARRGYEIATTLPGQDPAAALEELLRAIDDLDLVHRQERIHQQRLVAVMASRTGATAIPAGLVEDYQRLVERLDGSLHSSTSTEQSRSMYEEALGLLRQLFMPPELRLPELADLAEIADPTAHDASRVMALVATPKHLEYFFARVSSVGWLDLLDNSELLAPPDGQGSWPVFKIVERLRESAAEAIAQWLTKAFPRWGTGSPISAWFIARAALDVGPPGHDVVRAALRAHSASPQIAYLAISLVKAVDPQDQLVVEVADQLFNPSSGLDRSFGFEEISKALETGVTVENWALRVKLLRHKLAAVDDEDRLLRMLEDDPVGSISDRPEIYGDDRSALLVNALIVVLSASRAAGVPGQELLAEIAALRADLRPRVRSWLLPQLDDVESNVLVDELSDAIATRPPYGDDVRLVDQTIGLGRGGINDVERWRAALGPPPTVEEVGRALADGSPDESWRRATQWAVLLPDEVSAGWSKAIAVLQARFGTFSREAITVRRPVEARWGTSPMSEAELAEMPVEEAASWIARWRPDPKAWLVGARELARTLEAVAQASPSSWAAAPVMVISSLREPIYVSHYFRGLAQADPFKTDQAADLTEAVAFARTHPWQPTPLGEGGWDWDSTWANADDDGVALLRHLAEKDVGFGDRSEQAWRIVLEAATDGDEPGTYDDALTAAINRHQTRAVEAVFGLMGWQYRQTSTVRPQGLALLDRSLRIEGRDGEQHRAVIVPRLPFLLYIASEWVEERVDLIFGDAAPDGLAQAAVDLYVRWTRPSRWFFERVRKRLVEAVRRDVDNAMSSLLIAMLWRVDGYGVDEIVQLLAGMGDESLSHAGEMLGRLLRDDEVEPEHLAVGVEFFEAVLRLTRPASLHGFGWFAEIGRLDDQVWLPLTATAARLASGRLDWGHKVADRAAASDSERGLAILNDLVRGLADEWDRGQVMEKALASLRRANDLRDTDAFHRLRTSLLERGIFDAEGV